MFDFRRRDHHRQPSTSSTKVAVTTSNSPNVARHPQRTTVMALRSTRAPWPMKSKEYACVMRRRGVKPLIRNEGTNICWRRSRIIEIGCLAGADPPFPRSQGAGSGVGSTRSAYMLRSVFTVTSDGRALPDACILSGGAFTTCMRSLTMREEVFREERAHEFWLTRCPSHTDEIGCLRTAGTRF
ncbi:hypothetical protein SCHPADRAFT_760527 [Schizopora paradoxa]|uniref:Uncharacterized protein n=1 Tax=Schizopora paradoxa TaxID=27342 RepID=A0A0H2QYW1_9AGAM|nr:hypothetical protein SCHPADRAFT_760527 [Schizopora paradoxa]